MKKRPYLHNNPFKTLNYFYKCVRLKYTNKNYLSHEHTVSFRSHCPWQP